MEGFLMARLESRGDKTISNRFLTPEARKRRAFQRTALGPRDVQIPQAPVQSVRLQTHHEAG
jgi:hypothetical protein